MVVVTTIQQAAGREIHCTPVSCDCWSCGETTIYRVSNCYEYINEVISAAVSTARSPPVGLWRFPVFVEERAVSGGGGGTLRVPSFLHPKMCHLAS